MVRLHRRKRDNTGKDGYKNGVFFADGKLANWWYDDGTAWYFFQMVRNIQGKEKITQDTIIL